MRRRTFIHASVGALLAATVGARAQDDPSIETLRREWRNWLAPDAEVAEFGESLTLTEAQWRARLSPMQFRVLREEATEGPYTSALNDEQRPGVYVCVACDLPLFTSAMKFDSGTGWPSFFTTIPAAFGTKRDFLLLIPRTEYHCARCGGHHGHVFEDGPPPTNERWCNNGVALRFIPRAG